MPVDPTARKAQIAKIKGAIKADVSTDAKLLGRRIYAMDVALHDVDLSKQVHSLARLLPNAARYDFVSGYFDAAGEGINGHGMLRLAQGTLSKQVTRDATRIGIDPKIGNNNYTFMLRAAYEATPVAHIELGFEQGAVLKSTPGKRAAKASELPEGLMAELQQRHFGIKGVEVQKGTVVVRVGNRFEAPYADGVDRLIKRDVGDVRVRIEVDSAGDAPLGHMHNGMEVTVHNDGTQVPFLLKPQAEALAERLAGLGVQEVLSWPSDGSFLRVKDGTTPAQAQAIIDAFTALVPSDHVCVYADDRVSLQDMPPTFLRPGAVVAQRGDMADDTGKVRLRLQDRDPFAGVRDTDNWSTRP